MGACAVSVSDALIVEVYKRTAKFAVVGGVGFVCFHCVVRFHGFKLPQPAPVSTPNKKKSEIISSCVAPLTLQHLRGVLGCTRRNGRLPKVCHSHGTARFVGGRLVLWLGGSLGGLAF